MRDDWFWNGPSLREETRTARGHALELLFSVAGGSILLGLSINLFSSWLFQALSGQQVLLFIIIGSCVFILLLIIIVFAPRIFTTIKEFHEEVEILLPLLSSSEDVEVIRVKYYDTVTELLHAALARRPTEERKQIAQALQHLHSGSADGSRQEIVVFALELIQFLFTTQVVLRSGHLLGPQAAYRKSREVIQLLPSIVAKKWSDLANQVPHNRYFHQSLPGVPEKVRTPGGVDLHLPDLAQEISSSLSERKSQALTTATSPLKVQDHRSLLGRKRPTSGEIFGEKRPLRQTARKSQKQQADKSIPEEITVLKANVGHDTALAITVLASFSEHGLPTLTAPRRGFTARCILRNTRDQRLSSLVSEEETAATQLNDSGQPIKPISEGEPDPAIRYASAHTKLYEGNLRPYLLRVFVLFDGTFRINRLKNQAPQYGLYAWGTALAHQLAHMDIEEFMAALKDAGQNTPQRTF